MKIAIISDIHDNEINLAKTLNWCGRENIEALICCGDITNADTLKFISEEFKKDIYLIRGNMDIYEEKEVGNYPNIKYLGRFGRLELAGKKIGICHEPLYISEVKDLGQCDIIFYGHTHQPWQETKDGAELVNPGTLGGVFYKACFAVWDIDNNKLDLKLLELIK